MRCWPRLVVTRRDDRAHWRLRERVLRKGQRGRLRDPLAAKPGLDAPVHLDLALPRRATFEANVPDRDRVVAGDDVDAPPPVTRILLAARQVNVPLPEECYLAQINATRSIFREFAARKSLDGLEALFPTRAEDPILNSLLSLPCNEIRVPSTEKGALRYFVWVVTSSGLEPQIQLSGDQINHRLEVPR